MKSVSRLLGISSFEVDIELETSDWKSIALQTNPRGRAYITSSNCIFNHYLVPKLSKTCAWMLKIKCKEVQSLLIFLPPLTLFMILGGYLHKKAITIIFYCTCFHAYNIFTVPCIFLLFTKIFQVQLQFKFSAQLLHQM